MRKNQLPSGEELARQRVTKTKDGRTPTLQEIGDRYGVSRQAVAQAISRWSARQRETADVGS